MANCLVYMTAESPEQGREIGRALVAEKLVACVNVIEGMTSIYRWQGAVEEGSETVVIAKTREDLVDRLTDRVKQLHSYDCPCVVSLPISGGNPAFLAWIEAETG